MGSATPKPEKTSKKAIGIVVLLIIAYAQFLDHRYIGTIFSLFAALFIFPPYQHYAKRMWGSTISNKDFVNVSIAIFVLGFVISFPVLRQFITRTGHTIAKENSQSIPTSSPTSTAGLTSSTKQTKMTKSDTITLDRLAPVLLSFDVKQSNDRYIGYSHDGKSNITLIGSKDDIRTLMLALNNIKVKDVETYASLLESTLDAVFPTWNARSTWLTTSLRQLSNSTDPDGDSVETDVDNKHILLGYSPLNQGVSLTITVK